MMIDTIEEARARVKLGAAIMDTHRTGWRQEINSEQLEMSNPTLCLLGQTCGYRWGLDVLSGHDSNDERNKWAMRNGFEATFEGDGADEDQEYRLLEQAWREQLRS